MIDTSDILEDAWEIYWIKGHDRCLHEHVFDWRGSNIYLQRGKLLQTKLILTAEILFRGNTRTKCRKINSSVHTKILIPQLLLNSANAKNTS